MSNPTVKTRYEGIKKRSFEKMLEMFLFDPIINRTEKKLGLEDFQEFYKSMKDEKAFEEMSGRVVQSWQIPGSDDIIEKDVTVRDFNNRYDQWLKENRKVYQEIKADYDGRFISYDEFEEFFGKDDGPRRCEYCKITEQEIKMMIENGLITTKRLNTRGRTMEVDRRRPNGEYTKDNLVVCCYWCNNAKTDEFSEGEFILIGETMQKIWENRLSKIR